MTNQENKTILGKILIVDTNQEGKSWSCLGESCSRSLIVFLSQLFDTSLIVFGCFPRIHLSKIGIKKMFKWDVCAVQQDTFYPHQKYEHNSFYTKSRLQLFGLTIRDGKMTNCSQMAQNWNFSTNTWQTILFL